MSIINTYNYSNKFITKDNYSDNFDIKKKKCEYCKHGNRCNCNDNDSEIINLMLLISCGVYDNNYIELLKQSMKEYIATPWDSKNNISLSLTDYNNKLEEFKIQNPNQDLNMYCQNIYLNKTEICNAHAGNLFDHSQWAALQIYDWINNDNEIVKELEIITLLVAAFFHDIGKGGDNKYNMYDKYKYNAIGIDNHPKHCGDMILGKKLYFINNKTIDISKFILDHFSSVNINDIALAAYMHWEFGKLNIKSEDNIKIKIYKYLITFLFYTNMLNYPMNKQLVYQLKLCIAISLADISAGTNRRLIKYGDIVAKEKYVSFDPWTKYEMDQNHLEYREQVINTFIEFLNKLET